MSKQNISSATQIYYGGGYDARPYAVNGRKGVPVNLLTRVSLGSPIAADADYIIYGATSTNLPSNSTKTYTAANNGSAPCNAASRATVATITTAAGASVSVFVLDVPRALTAVVTNNSTVVACTITVTGYDVYGYPMSELFTVTADSSPRTVIGKKAFKYIYSVVIASGGDSTTNTVNVGINDILGLPYKLTNWVDVLNYSFNGIADTPGVATIVVADTTSPATTSTGDVRGTLDPSASCDGSPVVVWMHVVDPSTAAGLLGVTQV